MQKTLGCVSSSRFFLPIPPHEHESRDGVDPDKIVSKHIKLLHRYNEAKDATQVRYVVVDHLHIASNLLLIPRF